MGHFAYVLEGMKDLHALDATPLTVTADGKFFEGAYIFGAFSNSLSIGGMLKYDENSVDMNDGKLEMLLIRKPETLPDLHRLILALKTTIFRTSTSISLPRVRSACMPQRALIGQPTANTPRRHRYRHPLRQGCRVHCRAACRKRLIFPAKRV